MVGDWQVAERRQRGVEQKLFYVEHYDILYRDDFIADRLCEELCGFMVIWGDPERFGPSHDFGLPLLCPRTFALSLKMTLAPRTPTPAIT
jgi:hypothetical protein